MSPPEPVLIDCPVRERLAKFGRKHASSSETREEMISAASGNAGELLDLLDLGATDVETARAEVVNMSSGKTGVSPPTAAVQNFEAWRRAHRVLLYRVDTFFVFARITLDSLAVLLRSSPCAVRYEDR
jgi:hypothetical protein